MNDAPDSALDNAIASKGLLSVLKDSGNSNMQEPEKHAKILHEAKAHHMIKKEFPDTPKPRTLGAKIGHHIAEGDHDKASDLIAGHPLTGLVGKTHMKSIMGYMAEPMMNQEPHPGAFRGSVDYLANAHRGQDLIDKSISGLFDHKSAKMEHNPAHINDLKQHIDSLSANPQSMLDIGGDLGHYLPGHNAQLAALSASAVQYLSSLKPLNTQESPLDAVLPPSKAQMHEYDRQVGIVQNPLMALQHTKDGILLPADIATLQMVYPNLYKSISSRVGEQLIEAKSGNNKIPYKMRSSLSLLLGQPIDSTMTSQSMQAIMKANSPNQGSQQPNKGSKAPATAVKAADKANKMTETPLQKREIDKKP